MPATPGPFSLSLLPLPTLDCFNFTPPHGTGSEATAQAFVKNSNSSSNNRKFWLDFSAVLFRFQNCLRLLICLSRFLFSCSQWHFPQGCKLSHIHVSFKPSSSHGQSRLVLLSVKNAFRRHTHFGMTWYGISTESN